MVIDYYYLMTAVRNGDIPELKGWLSRRTGEIVFLTHNDHCAANWCGKDVAVDMIFNRAEIEAHSGEWIEIPKYDGVQIDTIERGEARERFALGFLANCKLGEYEVTTISTPGASRRTPIEKLPALSRVPNAIVCPALEVAATQTPALS